MSQLLKRQREDAAAMAKLCADAQNNHDGLQSQADSESTVAPRPTTTQTQDLVAGQWTTGKDWKK